jgi:hypothetical protein
MKFERRKTDKSKRILKRVFYGSFLIFFTSATLKIILNCRDTGKGFQRCEIYGFDATLLLTVFNWLSILSILLLLLTYIVHIFIEGFEKPKFVPTKTARLSNKENDAKNTL